MVMFAPGELGDFADRVLENTFSKNAVGPGNVAEVDTNTASHSAAVATVSAATQNTRKF